ncbi:MAG: mechanosensitive ion channel [Mucilaginibacter polytrichastri]|nr:mechanosensitive ion channel [Mucilaginibacter polytrichastri]
MTKFLTHALFLICFLPALHSAGQADTSARKNDSVNASLLHTYSRKLEQIAGQRRADSLQRLRLQEQLNSLRSGNDTKKEELQQQLRELKDKDDRRLSAKKHQIDSLRKTARGYPVNGFFNDTLFLVYSRQGGFTAQERAEAVTGRVQVLGDMFNYAPDSLRTAENEASFDILYGEKVITSVNENDALWTNVPRDSLARRYRNTINSAVQHYQSETSLRTLLEEIGLALLVIILIAIVVFYIGRLFRFSAAKIRAQEGHLIRGFRIKNYQLLDAKREVNALLSLNTILKWIVIIFIVYFTLPVLFGIFPWTKSFAETMFGYVLNPVKKIARAFWNYLPNLVTVLVIVFIFRYVIRGIRFLRDEVQSGALHIHGFYPDWANPTYQIVRVLVYAFMLIVIYPYLPGSDSAAFKGVSVFLGFLFTFGSAGSLANIVAGFVLTYMRLFKIGNRVKIGDVTGDVVEKSLLVTRLRTIKNEIVSIPNSTVMNSHTTNFSSEAEEKGLVVYTTLTMGYDVPWRTVHELLIAAAIKTTHIQAEPKPFVLQTSLDDFYASYQINAYTREANKQAAIYSELHQNIQDECQARGLEIMSPHFHAVRDGSRINIPNAHVPPGYEPPVFSVRMKKDSDKG